MEILIHMGLPKTSSSTLQFAVWKSLESQGILHLNTWRKTDPTEALDKRPSSRLFNREPINSEYLQFHQSKLNILSDESFTAPFRLRKNNYGNNIETAFSFPRKIRKQIDDLYQDKTIKVLVVLRNHCDLLFSQYVEEHNLKKFKNINFIFEEDNKTINLDGFEIYNYSRYLDEVYSVFGQENVSVLFYEQLKYDRRNFFEVLANLSNTDINFVSSAFECHDLNAKTKTEKGYYTKDRSTLIPYLTQLQKDHIKSHFKSDTRKLIERFRYKFDLKAYGY